MKILLLIMCAVSMLFTAAGADFLGIYDNGSDDADDSVWVYISMWDSLALKFDAPDTLFIYRFTPGGDTLDADTVSPPSILNFIDGYYMKRYRAGVDIGQYTVHAYGSGNGNYYSLADHNYFVNGLAAGELPPGTIGDIADSTRQLVWRTFLGSGYPVNGDTASALLYRIHGDVDGDGIDGIDYAIAGLNDIDSLKIYQAVLSALMADSAAVDTGDGSFAHAAVRAGSVPDSLLASVTKIDSIHSWVGSPYQAAQIPSLHMKIGLDYDGGSGVGNNIRDDLSSLVSMGGGSEPETLIIMSSTDSSKVQGARLRVRTLDQSTLKVTGLSTDINGRLVLALDPGSYWIEVVANNFNPISDTIVVTEGGGTDYLFMSFFDPGSPPQPGLCRVYGWVYDITGDSLADITVIAEIPTEYYPVKYENAVITPFSKSAVTDSTGYWQIDLIPSASLSGEGTEYLFTVAGSSGVIYRTKTTVPQDTSWQLQ